MFQGNVDGEHLFCVFLGIYIILVSPNSESKVTNRIKSSIFSEKPSKNLPIKTIMLDISALWKF